MTAIVSTAEATVAAPAERVWPLIDDPALMGTWFAFAERMELVEGTGAGRLQRLHGRWGRKRSEIDQRVVRYEPGRALSWVHERELLDGKPAPRFAAETHFEVTLSPAGDGTVVRMQTRSVPAGAVKGLLMRAFGTREVRDLMRRSLERLAAEVRPPG